MSLDSLLSNFEIDSSESGDEETEEVLTQEQLQKYSQLPAPPPPIASEISRIRKPTIERSISGSFKKFNTEEGKKVEDTRLLVLQELIVSEQDYVKDIAYIVQGFLQPLRAAGVCGQDVPVIFGNIELLYSINTDLLTKLNKQLETGVQHNSFVIGDIFIEMSNNLLSYGQYCSNHERASASLQKCLKQSVFSNEVEKCRNRMVGTGKLLHLPDLLIKPIQRICKYPLILKELLKFTDKSHDDHIPLLNAIRQVEEITNQINDHRRELENMQALTTIQRHLDGFVEKLAVTGRSFNREGILQKVNPRGKIQSRHFILLSDMLIWCKSKNGTSIIKNHFQYKGMLRLDLAVVRDAADPKLHKFQIIKLDTKKIYNLVAPTKEEKLSWMKSVDTLINIWLEVEKQKETEKQKEAGPKYELKQMTSQPNLQHQPKTGVSPQLTRMQTAKASYGNSRGPIASSPLREESPAMNDQNLLSRLEKLESAMSSLTVQNNSLQQKVIELEATVGRQGKELKKLKRGQTRNLK